MLAHNFKISVFAHKGEDKARIKDGLLALLPFDQVKEKQEIKEEVLKDEQFGNITVLEVLVKRRPLVAQFLESFPEKVSRVELERLREHIRFNERNYLILKIDKQMWLDERKIVPGDGPCFVLKMKLAAFPATKENVLDACERLFAFFLPKTI